MKKGKKTIVEKYEKSLTTVYYIEVQLAHAFSTGTSFFLNPIWTKPPYTTPHLIYVINFESVNFSPQTLSHSPPALWTKLEKGSMRVQFP